MNKTLKCVEWLNVNRNARAKIVKTDKKSKSASSGANKPVQHAGSYLLQVVGKQGCLACLTSDQIVNTYESANLKQKSQIQPRLGADKNINEIGFFKTCPELLFTCGDDGCLASWDLRVSETQEAMRFECSTREFLCADINSTDSLFCVGTNKSIDDALILIYDIRFNTKHLHKLAESHSKDVSQVRFEPNQCDRFSSASCDGKSSLTNKCLIYLVSIPNDYIFEVKIASVTSIIILIN